MKETSQSDRIKRTPVTGLILPHLLQSFYWVTKKNHELQKNERGGERGFTGRGEGD